MQETVSSLALGFDCQGCAQSCLSHFDQEEMSVPDSAVHNLLQLKIRWIKKAFDFLSKSQ